MITSLGNPYPVVVLFERSVEAVLLGVVRALSGLSSLLRNSMEFLLAVE